MLAGRKVGFLGGGKMAEAIIGGLISQNVVSSEQLAVSDPDSERLQALTTTYGLAPIHSNQKLLEWADILILAVKPQVITTVLEELYIGDHRKSLVISIAAGITTQQIENALAHETSVIRAMPNTPALVAAAATALAAGKYASRDDMALAAMIFDAVGITEVLCESKLNAVTGLSGSGPAYVFFMLEAFQEAGQEVGLSPNAALKLAAQTLMGSAKLLLETDGDPTTLKNMVTSPGGTSLQGLAVLEDAGLRTILIQAVKAATARASDLGATKSLGVTP